MIRVEAESAPDPGAAWGCSRAPTGWRTCAPHIRGAVGLGAPEVTAGARGAALLAGVVPIPGSYHGERGGDVAGVAGGSAGDRPSGALAERTLRGRGLASRPEAVGAPRGRGLRADRPAAGLNLAREAERTALAGETTRS